MYSHDIIDSIPYAVNYIPVTYFITASVYPFSAQLFFGRRRNSVLMHSKRDCLSTIHHVVWNTKSYDFPPKSQLRKEKEGMEGKGVEAWGIAGKAECCAAGSWN